MKSRVIIPALLVCCGVALSGCETYKRVVGRHAPFGTENLIDRTSFQKLDLALILTQHSETPFQLNKASEEANRKQLELAFKQFNTTTKDPKNDAVNKRLRNQVQERIVAASNQACAEFKRELKALDARANFILGSLITAVAGAGAIFSGGTSQALSGVASIFSGIRAEFNEDYFQMLTIQIITDGLGKKRQGIYKEILDNRKEGLTKYPVERAIADAIRYHDNCSLVAGLEQAALSIERAANPGLPQLERAFDEFGKVKAAFERAQKAGSETVTVAPSVPAAPAVPPVSVAPAVPLMPMAPALPQ